ncbi:MAG: hypothetical protein QOI24_180 [Acidobacteriota bacterium]|jgi:hypothetical protein|nr:hypothetical protein [Acidobacteriota bacterium]
MKYSSIAFYTAVLISTAAAHAAHVDMKEPRRAVGREDDIRIDAMLTQETLTSGTSIGVIYQIENLTSSTIAIADKVVDVSYDSDSHTITFAIGSEVPNATMPHLVLIAPGQKRVLSAGGAAHIVTPRVRSPFVSVPQQIQITVNVLRDVKPFAQLAVAQPISDALFDIWVETNDSIALNALPVRWKDNSRGVAERSSAELASAGSW